MNAVDVIKSELNHIMGMLPVWMNSERIAWRNFEATQDAEDFRTALEESFTRRCAQAKIEMLNDLLERAGE